jgi:hypothetical protein
LRYFHVVFLPVDLRVKRFNLTIRDTNSKCCSNFGIFHNIQFFLKKIHFFFIKILFAVFNVLFIGYSLAKNNLNNTYQYNISKSFSKTMNYLIILIKFRASRFLCRSVYNHNQHFYVIITFLSIHHSIKRGTNPNFKMRSHTCCIITACSKV